MLCTIFKVCAKKLLQREKNSRFTRSAIPRSRIWGVQLYIRTNLNKLVSFTLANYNSLLSKSHILDSVGIWALLRLSIIVHITHFLQQHRHAESQSACAVAIFRETLCESTHIHECFMILQHCLFIPTPNRLNTPYPQKLQEFYITVHIYLASVCGFLSLFDRLFSEKSNLWN